MRIRFTGALSGGLIFSSKGNNAARFNLGWHNVFHIVTGQRNEYNDMRLFEILSSELD